MNNVSDLLVEINKCHQWAGVDAYTRDVLSRCHREIRRLRGERAGDQSGGKNMSDYGVQVMRERDEARAEIERLRADNEIQAAEIDRLDSEIERLRALNAELEAALRIIADRMQCPDNLMSDKDVARAALAKAEEK